MKRGSRAQRTVPALLDLAGKLRGRARRITGPRQAILEALVRRAGPMSAREIFNALPEGECDLATVYRSIQLLERMELVKRFDFGDRGARFELLGEGDDGHHHHLICVECADVVELDQCFPVALEQDLALRSGYKAITHKLEFFGVCPRCQ